MYDYETCRKPATGYFATRRENIEKTFLLWFYSAPMPQHWFYATATDNLVNETSADLAREQQPLFATFLNSHFESPLQPQEPLLHRPQSRRLDKKTHRDQPSRPWKTPSPLLTSWRLLQHLVRNQIESDSRTFLRNSLSESTRAIYRKGSANLRILQVHQIDIVTQTTPLSEFI